MQQLHQKSAIPPADGPLGYATPYGRWAFQPWVEGGWKIVYHFDSEGVTENKIKMMVTDASESINKLSPKRFARLTGWKGASRICVWQLPGIAGLMPLATQPPPMAQEKVFMIAARLLPALQESHQHGVAIHDMTPSLVFVNPTLEHCMILPTPWLPLQIRWKPNFVQQMPFVAPESEAGTTLPNPMIADIYGFGAFIWFLLTGQHRKTHSEVLPSGLNLHLARWDLLIDGCCRTNPQHRFQTLHEVASALQGVRTPTASPNTPPPPPQAGTKNSPSTDHSPSVEGQGRLYSQGRVHGKPERTPASPSRPKRKRRVGKVVLLLLVVVGLLIAYIHRGMIADIVPEDWRIKNWQEVVPGLGER